MRKFVFVVCAVMLAAFASQLQLSGAQTSDVKADYDRSNSLGQRVANKVYDVAEAPVWIEGSPKFWYRKSVKGGNQFVLVDPVAAAKAPAFDHARVATSLSAVAGASYTAVSLPFTTFTFVNSMGAIEFAVGGAGGGAGRGGAAPPAAGAGAPAAPRYRCTLTDYTCTRLPAPEPAAQGAAAGQGRAGGGGRAGGAAGAGAAADQPETRPSPDGKWEAYIQNYNMFIRPVAAPGGAAAGGGAGRAGGGAGGGGRQGGGAANQAIQLSFDGSEGNAYSLGGRGGGGGGGAAGGGGAGGTVGNTLPWSPDSQKLAAFRVRPGYNRLVTYVQSSPSDQLQPKASTNYYQKPGDVVAYQQPVLFDVASKKQTIVEASLFPNPYNNGSLGWKRDSSAFTFEYNERGHQAYRVIEVDAATGKARALVDETSKTFIYYNAPAEAISGSGRKYRYDTRDGKEIVWMSQRDGWAHLYLYDRATGQVKNQITKGSWQVHLVDRVDEQNRQIYFRGNGMDAGKDPYFLHYFRVNFDGTGLVRYTTADGTHTVSPNPLQWTANQQYYVDTYSRVDMPPVSELRKVSDQSLVMPLEKADVTDLLATGFKMPEVFMSKGRDGTTDIWGIIIRPTNFDPAKKYPVIENIYAGPQGSFVPKAWSTQAGMMGLAELGFIVVQVDGMGTANRSKAFHDVAWKNIGDAGFPDRILWHKAIAAKYSYYDITRVGIYGTSAGGQNSTGGVLFHPEFYKVAVSNSGCHDNRMDKLWWNEQWMGWPLGPQYSDSSNVDHAANLRGRLQLVVPEMDTNVDPSSTMQVVNKLVQAGKEFELVVIPGANHGAASPITVRKRNDFFVKWLRNVDPPNWNDVPVPSGTTGGDDELDPELALWIAGEYWQH